MWNAGWNDLFRKKAWGRYPGEDVIRFVMRHFSNAQQRQNIRILEIGCGTGANIWFLAREGIQVFGLDGSSVALDIARKRFSEESLEANLTQEDAGNLPYDSEMFDAVMDVECIYANDLKSSKIILGEVHRVLKPKGLFFSRTFATGCSGEGSGPQLEGEKNTYEYLTEGPFNSGYGIFRFTEESEIPKLYGQFRDLSWELMTRTTGNRSQVIREWVIEGHK